MVMNNQKQPDPYWPFPTKDNPLPSYKDIKPWTPKEMKAYAKLQREKAQESPL